MNHIGVVYSRVAVYVKFWEIQKYKSKNDVIGCIKGLCNGYALKKSNNI